MKNKIRCPNFEELNRFMLKKRKNKIRFEQCEIAI
jgi:hypothetical protein